MLPSNLMEYRETLDDYTPEQRLKLLLSDSVKYVRLMTDADVDRLLANLAKRPIRKYTQDHADLDEITRWWEERYPNASSRTE